MLSLFSCPAGWRSIYHVLHQIESCRAVSSQLDTQIKHNRNRPKTAKNGFISDMDFRYFCPRRSRTFANLKLKFIAQLTSNCSRKSRKWSGLWWLWCSVFGVWWSMLGYFLAFPNAQRPVIALHVTLWKLFPTHFHIALALPIAPRQLTKKRKRKKHNTSSRGKPMKSEWKIKSTCVFFGLGLWLDDDIKR